MGYRLTGDYSAAAVAGLVGVVLGFTKLGSVLIRLAVAALALWIVYLINT